MTLGGTHARVSLFPGTPGSESRNCPEIVLGKVPGLWELITPDCKVWSQQGLNQTCSPHRDLSNDVLHYRFGGRKKVDSRLLVVGSQIGSLTPGPSFAHNLGYRCPNDQCEAIFYMYASRTFQWHQEHLDVRCFGPCCQALNIRESRRTPNPHFFQVLDFTPTLGQSRVATTEMSPKVRKNKGARSYSPRSNWKYSSRWEGPTLVSWWRPSKWELPRVKGSNRPSSGTLMVPAIARLWMLGLRRWTTTCMPPRLDEIPPWSLPNPIWKATPPHGGGRSDKRRGRTTTTPGSSSRSGSSRNLFQGILTTFLDANSVTLWMPRMKIWGIMWGLTPSSCLRSGTCTSWIVYANLWWGFPLGPSESLRRVGPPHCPRPSRKWRTSRMWGGMTNPGSRRTTSSFTRSRGMRENGIGGKEAQPRKSPNNSKARDSNQKGVLWKKGLLQKGALSTTLA